MNRQRRHGGGRSAAGTRRARRWRRAAN